MRHRAWLLGLMILAGHSARAQETGISFESPADRILRFRSELALDSAQVLKLRELAKSQVPALTKATAAFLRAEADLLDATRNPDLAIRRVAMEKRARVAIDGEMIRLRAERDTRAVLTSRQVELVPIVTASAPDEGRERTHALWESQVSPLPLNAISLAIPDSGNVRITVEPLTTEIYVGDRLAGQGRLAARLPLGAHTLKFRTPACMETVQVTITKGPPAILTHKMGCSK